MRCLLLAVLILSALAVAQPLTGPFMVYEEADLDRDLSGAALTVHDSLAFVFIMVSSDLYYMAVNPATGTVETLPTLLRPGETGWEMTLPAVGTFRDEWTAVVHEKSTLRNRTWHYRGRDTISARGLLDESSSVCWPDPNTICHSNNKLCFALAPAQNGITFLGWLNTWRWITPWRNDFGYWFQRFQVTDTSLSENADEDFDLGFRGHALRLQIHTPDSVGALVSTGTHLMQAVWPITGWGPSWTERPCTGLLAEWLLPPSGTSLVLMLGAAPDSASRVVALVGDECEDRMVLTRPPLAWASHPAYGMAWIAQTEDALLLHRIDDTGTEVHPAGRFSSVAADYNLSSAALTIGDDGRIILAWSEGSDLPALPARLRVASVGWTTALGIDEPSSSFQPLSFSLQPFPNPFNSELRIAYTLPRAQPVELAVYNVLGQEVATLLNGPQLAGSHTATWQPQTGSGMYWVVLRGNTECRVAKVLYLK